MVTTDEVHHDRVAVHGDAGMMADGVDQRALNLTACRVLRVQMRLLLWPPRARDATFRLRLAENSPRDQKVTNPVARFVHDGSDHRFVTRSCSRCRVSCTCASMASAAVLSRIAAIPPCAQLVDESCVLRLVKIWTVRPPSASRRAQRGQRCRCRPQPPAVLRARLDLRAFPFDRIGEADRAIDAAPDIPAWASGVAGLARCLVSASRPVRG